MNTMATESGGAAQRRPGWVWAISIFFMFSAIIGTLSFFVVLSGGLPMTDAQQRYFASLTFVDYVLTFLIALVNLCAAVLLFMLRRLAYGLFVATFVLGMLSVAWQIVARHWLSAMTIPGLIGAVIGWGLNIAVILYTRSLVRRGVLV